MTAQKLSVVLPCYNEAKSIPCILERFSRVMGNHQAELVLVNNGSSDNTAEILEKELKNPRYKFARSVLVKKNQGYGHGIMVGLKHCRSDIVAYSHADMQCDPKDVFRAFDNFMQKNSARVLVKGNRKGRRNIFTTGLHYAAQLFFLRHFDDINGQPKVFHRSLLNRLKTPPKDFAFDFYVQYAALKNGYKVISMPVKFSKRIHGQSNWAATFSSRAKTVFKFIKYLVKLRLFGD